jgi:hypothetical protein
MVRTKNRTGLEFLISTPFCVFHDVSLYTRKGWQQTMLKGKEVYR